MAMMRENQESGDPPFGPIDLVSGKVVIRLAAEEPVSEENPGSPRDRRSGGGPKPAAALSQPSTTQPQPPPQAAADADA